MTLPLPNLDDRRWQDLVEEGQSLIPLFEPEWTDHNIHDPGIMLIELLAWISEMDIYWLNRIPDSHRYKFLAMLGYSPHPPRPSHTLLALTLKSGRPHFHLPLGVHFSGLDGAGDKVLFSTSHSLNVVPGAIESLYLQRGERWENVYAPLSLGEQPYLLGMDPQPGDTLYIGFSEPLPPGVEATLALTLAGECGSAEVWKKLETETQWRAAFCPPGLPPCDPLFAESTNLSTGSEILLRHHSVRLTWEYYDNHGRWRPLDPQTGQVKDGTRALSLDGLLRFTLPGAMSPTRLGDSTQDLNYLRVRFEHGAYDIALRLQCLALNAVGMLQAAERTSHTWSILPGASITGSPPTPGFPASFEFQLDDQDRITALDFRLDGPPGFTLLDYKPPQNRLKGQLMVAAENLSRSEGSPNQVRQLTFAPISSGDLSLFSWEDEYWVNWQVVPDLLNAHRADALCQLDPSSGEIRFGNGEHGRSVPEETRLYVGYQTTHAQDGNLPSEAVNTLVQDDHNRALLSSPEDTVTHLETIRNPIPASGGLRAETLDQLQARVLTDLAHSSRAVTLADIEGLALETPGACLARVTAIPNLHPAYPCYQAPGVITIVVLPFLPLGKPIASSGLIHQVQAYLGARRVVGTRLLVTGPRYRRVAVRAKIRSTPGTHSQTAERKIVEALDGFFHPLTGGPEGSGWPFGRSIYRSEVLQVIDETSGVDHVINLELIDGDGQASCGNLCLQPLELVAAQPHQIEVIEP